MYQQEVQFKPLAIFQPFLACFPRVCKLCIFPDIIENVGSNLLAVLFMESSIRTVCTYSDFFLVWKLCLTCKLCLLIQTIADLWIMLILEVFNCEIKKSSFLITCVYKKLKPNDHLLFLATFLDLEMIQFRCVNYVDPISKFQFLFWTCQKFWAIGICI